MPTAYLKSEMGTVRSVTFYPFQQEKVKRYGGNESYNREGAIEYLRREKDTWERSDQFIGKALKIEVDD